MARDSIIADSRAATLGFTLLWVTTLITFCLGAPLDNWLDDPCHYKLERQTRHSRDANHSELWKKQFKIAKSKFTHDLLPKMKHQYKQMNFRFNNKNCPAIPIPRKMQNQTPINYYMAIREYAMILDQSANFKDLPKTVDFNEGARKDIFELARNMTRELLCEIYDSIPENERKTTLSKPKLVKSPHNVTKMMAQDYSTLKCFGRFLTMSTKNINGKKKGGKGKGGKNKKNAKAKNQRKHNNKRKLNIAS